MNTHATKQAEFLNSLTAEQNKIYQDMEVLKSILDVATHTFNKTLSKQQKQLKHQVHQAQKALKEQKAAK